MYSLSQQDTSRDNRLNMLVESRVRREVQARFGGEFLETYRRNTARHRVLSLRLKAQYLYLFAGGLLAVFLVFVILYMAGVNRWFCIALCVASATGITLGVFRLNRKYGPHGLMKLAAAGYRPYYIINRKRITSLFKRRKYAKHTQSGHPGK